LNHIKKLASQTVIYGLSSVIGRLLNYLLVPLYTRFFLPEEYGLVTEIYAYVAFLVIILTYGFETAFFRFTDKKKSIENVYSTTLISISVSSCIFIFLMFLASPYIATHLGYGIESRFIKWFAIIVGFDAISSISFARIRLEERAILFSSIKLLNIITNISLNLYFIVYKGLGIEYIFISNFLSSVLTILCLIPTMTKAKLSFDYILWKKMVIYALPLLIAGLAGITNETLDRVLLKHLLPISETASYELGIYGAFYKLSIIMVLFVQTFRFAAEPFFFSYYKNEDNRQIYADIMKYFIIVLIVIFLLVTIFFDFFIGFLGSEFHDERGFVVVSILLLANLFLGIYFNLSIWYKLSDKTFFGAYLALFGATITIVLNLLLIPKIGFIGSAWATLSCYFAMALASYLLSKKHFPIPFQTWKISFYILIMLAIYFLVYNKYFNLGINALFLLGFIIFVYILDKPQKTLKNEC